MRGLLYYGNKSLKYSEDIEEPQIVNPNDVKVKVAYCGICGTDLHEYLDGPIFFPGPGKANNISGLKLPLCPGHEFSGIVEDIGANVTRCQIGDRVVVEGTAHCSDRARYKENGVPQDLETCVACKIGKTNCCESLGFCGLGVGHGAMGEKVVVGDDHIVHLPDSIPFTVGALVEPLSVAWHAVECSNFNEGDTALVLGGGPIGLATVLALQGHKAGKIVVSEPAAIRREYAAQLGAEVFDPTKFKDAGLELKKLIPENQGFHKSFDCSGIPATYTASILALGARGVAVNVAIFVGSADHKPMDLTYQEKFATGSMCYTVKDFEMVIEALKDGLIDVEKARVLITGKVDVENAIEDGFMQLINHKDTNVKILVKPSRENIFD